MRNWAVLLSIVFRSRLQTFGENSVGLESFRADRSRFGRLHAGPPTVPVLAARMTSLPAKPHRALLCDLPVTCPFRLLSTCLALMLPTRMHSEDPASISRTLLERIHEIQDRGDGRRA